MRYRRATTAVVERAGIRAGTRMKRVRMSERVGERERENEFEERVQIVKMNEREREKVREEGEAKGLSGEASYIGANR